jgi:ATP-binding cassette, subfamily C (CFTR/MRP), member 1
VVLLVLLCIPGAGISRTWASTPIVAFTLAVSVAFVFLSHLEHTRNVRPSTTLTLYHAFTLLFDAIRTQTICALPNNLLFSAVFTTAVSVKLVVTVLESIEKRKILQEPYTNSPRETLSGVFNRNVFWWLNPLLGAGFSKIIELVSLPVIDVRLNCPEAQTKLQKRWDTCTSLFPYQIA